MTRGGEEFRLLSLPEAIDRLRSPYAQAEFASLTGDGVLVVDLPAGEGALPPVREIDAACRGLAQLACPTVGLVPGELSPTVARVAGAFDVILPGGASELAVVLSRVRAQPRASLALVQLLRHNAFLDVHEGLIAESLVYSTLQAGPEFTGWLAGRTRGKRDASTAPAVRMERTGSTLRLTLNRPERHNAFGLSLRDGLVEGLQLALSDDSVEEVVLAGALAGPVGRARPSRSARGVHRCRRGIARVPGPGGRGARRVFSVARGGHGARARCGRQREPASANRPPKDRAPRSGR